ncbi:MAG: glycosyltransferase [Cytophagaceae bacterium]|nr:glycosyltransferase [Cytophagaceae bacterium]MDW8456210.1 glycosyltransferase [Cytophagaceae bacterium]
MIVSTRNEVEKNKVLKMAYDAVEESAIIEKWTDNPKYYHEVSSVYVLPPDQVFANFSLLEAMEKGLPAVVANVEHADKIIDHNINGLLCEQNKDDFAKCILKL